MFSDCPGCSTGDHDQHVQHWGVRPEGVIDGDFCYCAGDCAERKAAFFAEFTKAMDDALGLTPAPTPEVEAGERETTGCTCNALSPGNLCPRCVARPAPAPTDDAVPEGDEAEALDEPTARHLLRNHYPTGPYLPIGHLDGDCKQGCGAWPCEQAHKALAVIGYFTAEMILAADASRRPAVAPERETVRRSYEVQHDGSGRPSSERDGPCTCDYNPETTGGPEEDCPFHGRSYAEWVQRGDTLAERLSTIAVAPEAVAEVLAEHRFDVASTLCSAGDWAPTLSDELASDQHRAHVAAALAARMGGGSVE